jgi:Hydrazine synthase alpha subunit middle domain
MVFSVIVAIGSCSIFFCSCRQKSMNGMIIFTQDTGKVKKDINFVTGDSWRYTSQTRIVALDPDKAGRSLKILSAGYYSARSPEISTDGKFLLFAAQKKQNDHWQIWEMNLTDFTIRQVTFASENCTDPAYLPGGRLVFSKLSVHDSLKAGHSLYTCNIDGSNIKRITFNPHTYFASAILKDGRILTIDRQLYPDQGDQMFMILRPDGTKAEMFYKGIEGSTLFSRGWETISGKIVFIESGKSDQEGGDIISINYNRPLHSRVNLTSEIKGDFHTVFPLQSGKFLVSYRPSDTNRFALYEFDPVNKIPGKVVYASNDLDAIEAVVVEKHDSPKKLPSEVDMGVKTGLLLCQDINVLGLQSEGNHASLTKASGIEVLGTDSTLGVVQADKDGSFYLKVMADKPFKIQTIDKNGHVLHGPCGWIWLRPNERRGCAGCHEDHEMAPENRVPLSVKKPPVAIPVHINKVVEKKVSLE